MQNDHRDEPVIELGRISLETRGLGWGIDDQEGGLDMPPGLGAD